MKSLSSHINEKLIINKNYKNPESNLGDWEIRSSSENDFNGYFCLVQKNYDVNDNGILYNLFYSTCKQTPLPTKIAYKRFIDNDEPVLTTFVDNDGNNNYIAYGWHDRIFGGRFALWFVENESKHELTLDVYFSTYLTVQVTNKIYTEKDCKNRDNFAIEGKEYYNIIQTYLKIEDNAK